MPTLSSIVEGARDVAAKLTYSGSHPGHEVMSRLAGKVAEMEKALAGARSAGDTVSAEQLQKAIVAAREQIAAESGALQNMQAGKEKLTGQLSGATSALTALGGAGGIGYMANRLAEPDAESRFKLGEWVDGFVEKCAEYGVDGASLLEEAVAGDVKTAGSRLDLLFKALKGGARTAGNIAKWTPAVAGGLGVGALGLGYMGAHNVADRAAAREAVHEAEKLEDVDENAWLAKNMPLDSQQDAYDEYMHGLANMPEAPKYGPSYRAHVLSRGNGAKLPPQEEWDVDLEKYRKKPFNPATSPVWNPKSGSINMDKLNAAIVKVAAASRRSK